ncbi:MAG: hypothetical protein AAB434_10260 [Planctomycetota bacterium]
MGKSDPLRPAKGSRGVVLIFSIAVLGMLALLAFTFASISRVERNVSRNYVDQVRSKMLATSGVEVAVGRLTQEIRDPATMLRHKFYGEDMNEDGVANPGEDVNGNGWEEESCPLNRAPHPSYMHDVNRNARADAGDMLDVEGKLVGVTGILPSTYTQNGDIYSVKVSDLSRKLNVNMDGHPHLQPMLENLCEVSGLGRGLGTRLFQNRPYGSLLEIRDRLRLTATEFEKVKNLFTVYGWFDKKVVNAVPLNQRIRAGLAVGTYVYTWEEVRPRRIDFPKDANGTVVGRCPVNVNLAPREVLIALLWNLTGFYLDEESLSTDVNDGYAFMSVFYTYSGANGALGQIRQAPPISRTQAERVADAIVARRRATQFTTWQDFNKFLWDDCWTSGILSRQQMDVLKANFNPNSQINDFNPEYFRFAWVDKTDLTYWTTELTFAPAGYYEVESIGRVLNQFRQIVAESEVLVDVKMFDIYRESTQKDFLYDQWKNNDDIKDNIISRERGSGKTSGDLSLMVYPEMPNPAWTKDADYDGHITLATKESSGASADFLATYYERGLNSDSGHTFVRDANGPYFDKLVNQAGGSGSWKPGKLFPDGVYAELDSVAMYDYMPRNPNSFSASFWIKPHFFPEHAGRSRVFMTWQKNTGDPYIPVMPLGVYCTVTSFIESTSEGGYEYQEPWDTPAILAGGTVESYEGACATPCINHLEHGHGSIDRGGETWGTMFEGGKWLHVGWIHDGERFEGRGYDYPATHHENMDVLYVNGRKVSGVFAYQTGDVSTPTPYDGEMLRLGERRTAGAINTVPDATMDEVIVWDRVNPNSENRILDEFNDGRFYNEEDGTFTSRAIDLAAEANLPPGTPVQIATVAWTPFVPVSLPNGRITVELVKAYDRSGLPGGREYTQPGGEKADVIAGEPIRYRVHFYPGVGGGDGIVDSLVFDDITITLTKGPRFLSWAWVMQ